MIIKNQKKALVLFSGGLDSVLAVKILEREGFEITGISFSSFFFETEKVTKIARDLGIKIVKRDFSLKHLKLLKSPRFGFGKGLNPCLDCRLLMFSETKNFLEKNKFDLLASGEVLNQRPFSQGLSKFQLIERELDLQGLILRPLSARKLPLTIYEKKGIINRDKLFGIVGKSRREQLKIAKKFKVKSFIPPGGGCVLTEKKYSEKLKKMLYFTFKKGNFKKIDFSLLKMGRNFWLNGFQLILGRNQKENEFLTSLKLEEKTVAFLERKDKLGPVALIRCFDEKNIFDKKRKIQIKKSCEKVKELIWFYSKNKPLSYQELEIVEFLKK